MVFWVQLHHWGNAIDVWGDREAKRLGTSGLVDHFNRLMMTLVKYSAYRYHLKKNLRDLLNYSKSRLFLVWNS